MKIDGTPVVNATKKIVLRITRGDCRKGSTKDPGSCAAALALKRRFGASDARVHIGRTYVKVSKRWTRYSTSKALRTEIIAFDRGGRFEPGSYVLEPVHESSKPTGRRQGGKSSTAGRAKRKRVPYHTVTGVRHHGANR